MTVIDVLGIDHGHKFHSWIVFDGLFHEGDQSFPLVSGEKFAFLHGRPLPERQFVAVQGPCGEDFELGGLDLEYRVRLGELIAHYGRLIDHHLGGSLGYIELDDLSIVVVLLLDALQVLILDGPVPQETDQGHSVDDNQGTDPIPHIQSTRQGHEDPADDEQGRGDQEVARSGLKSEHKFYYSRMRRGNS